MVTFRRTAWEDERDNPQDSEMLEADDSLVDLPGRKKAAILLTCLGPKHATQILQELSDVEASQVARDIALLGPVDATLKSTVLTAFYQMLQANEAIVAGDIETARAQLEKAYDADEAGELLGRMLSNPDLYQDAPQEDTPFQFLQQIDPVQVADFIQEEHPQTIALILAHLTPATSARILSTLPQPLQGDVLRRIATMERTTPEIVAEVEQVLERKLSAVYEQEFSFAGGVKEVANILNRIDRKLEKKLMSDLEKFDPALADAISRLMFTFEDIVLVDDNGIQMTMREIEIKDLALALKTASALVVDKIYRNISDRAKRIVEEEIDYMGPVHRRSIEAAQQKIVEVIRRLEESGALYIAGRGVAEERDDRLI